MLFFDEFKDALEDAKWSADTERVRQYIFLLKDAVALVAERFYGVDVDFSEQLSKIKVRRGI